MQKMADDVAQFTTVGTRLVRMFGWMSLTILCALMINNIFVVGADYPGPLNLTGNLAESTLLIALLAAAVIAAVGYVMISAQNSLRADAERISSMNRFLIRGCFYAVLFVGLSDALIAFMRVEGLIEEVISEEVAKLLARSKFVALNVHIPAVVLGFIVGIFARGLGFTWLALMIVLAELLIVISRFVFSYEQALMGDLVRYWYAALFLFASVHTLYDDSHVRVDVLYAGFADRKKGAVNGMGTILLGMTTCWTIIVIGFGHSRAIINSPIASFEISQTGTAGMFIKYQMAAFLGVFAITMLIQFASYFLEAYADYRGEPGKRETAEAAH